MELKKLKFSERLIHNKNKRIRE